MTDAWRETLAKKLFGDRSTWMSKAECSNHARPEIFFPNRGGSVSIILEAKQTCAGCSVFRECLHFALKNNEQFGVWGGLALTERRVILNNQADHVDKCKKCGLIKVFTRKESRMCDDCQTGRRKNLNQPIG